MKLRFKRALAVLFAASMAFAACGGGGGAGGDSGSGSPNGNPTGDFEITTGIYVAGGYQSTTAGNVACLWKVTEKDEALVAVKKELPGNAVANAMVFYNDTIYIAGALVDASTGAKSACYWTVGKDGMVARHALDGVEATSVTVDMLTDSGSVYFGGHYLYEGSVKAACWWQLREGTATRYDLMDGDREMSYATDIKIADGVIYAPGVYSYSGAVTAAMWRMIDDSSGMRRRLVDDNLGDEGTAIFVTDPDSYSLECVYMAGYRTSPGLRASYWKWNMKAASVTRTDLNDSGDTNDSKAYSIFVDGEVVYTAGIYNDHPCFWTGTMRTDLGTYQGEARYILVLNEGVLAAGSYLSDGTAVACLWAVNSEYEKKIDLTSASDTNISGAYCRSIITILYEDEE